MLLTNCAAATASKNAAPRTVSKLAGAVTRPPTSSAMGRPRFSYRRHRIEEMCRCPFNKCFATSSALSATNHPLGALLEARRPLLPHVPPMLRLIRLEVQ
jgi:hypothetical protein